MEKKLWKKPWLYAFYYLVNWALDWAIESNDKTIKVAASSVNNWGVEIDKGESEEIELDKEKRGGEIVRATKTAWAVEEEKLTS